MNNTIYQIANVCLSEFEHHNSLFNMAYDYINNMTAQRQYKSYKCALCKQRGHIAKQCNMMCKKCNLPHGSNKPCIGLLKDFIIETNWISWSLLKQTRKKMNKVKGIKNIDDLLHKLEDMEKMYNKARSQFWEKAKKDLDDRKIFDYSKEYQKELGKVKEKEKERMSSFSFFKTPKSAVELETQAKKNTDIKLDEKIKNIYWYFNPELSTANFIINRYQVDLAKTLAQEKNLEIKQFKEKMQQTMHNIDTLAQEEYDKMKKEQMRLIALKEEAYKQKTAAARQAKIVQWKAQEALRRNKNDQVAAAYKKMNEKTVNQVLNGKAVLTSSVAVNSSLNKAIERLAQVNLKIREATQAKKSVQYAIKNAVIPESLSQYIYKYSSVPEKTWYAFGQNTMKLLPTLIKDIDTQLDKLGIERKKQEAMLKKH